MVNNKFPIDNPRRLKDWVNNMAKKNNLAANTVLQNYMMERFLERVSISKYRDNFILKGGFLIAAMVGIDMRSTMDMDTTIKYGTFCDAVYILFKKMYRMLPNCSPDSLSCLIGSLLVH